MKILQQDGPLAFAQGIGPALWRQGVWNGAYFFTIHMLKTRVLPEPEGKAQTMLRNFVAGLAGGMLGTTLNPPFDVATSRMVRARSFGLGCSAVLLTSCVRSAQRNVLPGEVTPCVAFSAVVVRGR